MTALSLSLIRTDGGTQPRAAIDFTVIEEYAQALSDGVAFPAVTVFYDGADYWLADGFHRFNAAKAASLTEIDADIRQGVRRDAVLFSVGANAAHGMRRTNDDKRRAVLTLLNDPDWAAWSDREIARRCSVSDRFVNSIRPKVTANIRSEERTYITKHGSPATMNTLGINADRPRPQVAPLNTESFADWHPQPAQPRVPEPAPQPEPVRFDHALAEVREKAINAIRALASQPSPEDVIEAWNSWQNSGYPEPVENIERAINWLQRFLPLFREAEATRCARVELMVQRSLEETSVGSV